MNVNTLSKEEYVQYCNNLADDYEAGVINGSIIANKYIKQAVIREQSLRQKYDYKQDKVDAVFKFAYHINIEKKQRIKLLAYQCWVIKSVFGLYKNDGFRLRREALVWIARKNGKTAFTALLSLYSMLKENNGCNNEVYFLATTQKQATQALICLKSMISCSPALKKRVDVLQYRLRANKTSFATPLAANPSKLDSLNPTFAILDESHAHKTRELYNIIKTGQVARKEALLFEISTAGFNKAFPFYTAIEQAKRVLNNDIEDDTLFIALYTLDEEIEIEKPEYWIKSNPSLGEILDIDILINDFNKAKRTQTELNSFIIKNLNFYLDSENTWIEDNLIKNASKQLKLTDFEGCKAWLGLDLSATRDLTALTILIEREGLFYFFNEYFYPLNNDKLVRLSGLDISGWINNGFIQQHPNKSIDYDLILFRINELSEILDIQSIGYDKWNSNYLISKLSGNYQVVNCPQNTSFYNLPMKYFEKEIFENHIVIDKNPVTRWMFQNLVLYMDSNNCIKPTKKASKDSIDGVITMMMCLGLFINENIENEAERKRIIGQAEILKNWYN